MHAINKSQPILNIRQSSELPLVVDLDGTLIRTDLLVEGLLSAVGRNVWSGFRLVAALSRGKGVFKAVVAAAGELDVATLPYNPAVLDLIKQAKVEGRPVYLATAADQQCASAIARHLGLFDGVYASCGGVNLAGQAKADRLEQEFGFQGFDYIGNDSVDAHVWKSCRTAYIANAAPSLIKLMKSSHDDVQVISVHERTVKDYAKALRVHQWLKNLLLFVPALADHNFTLSGVGLLIAAFVSFSLCASSVYLLNDLLDLRNDRDHPTKCLRPFARGAIPAIHGIALVPILLLASMTGAAFVSLSFAGVLAAYYGLTLLYSLKLKRLMMLDVVTLAGLYGVRVVAGAVALSIPLSHWLVGFAIFLFLCLALVKRATELIAKLETGASKVSGRGYSPQDLAVVEAMSAAAGFVGVLVLALYINSPEVTELYANPTVLWAACIVLIYWIGRILLLTHRGEMHDDPVVFAVTDKVSLACGAALCGIVMASL